VLANEAKQKTVNTPTLLRVFGGGVREVGQLRPFQTRGDLGEGEGDSLPEKREIKGDWVRGGTPLKHQFIG